MIMSFSCLVIYQITISNVDARVKNTRYDGSVDRAHSVQAVNQTVVLLLQTESKQFGRIDHMRNN